MERAVLSHDTATGTAVVKFIHNNVTYQDTFDLKKVVPGSEYTFAQMNIDFTEEYQLKALDALTASIQRQIEEGIIKNPSA